MVSWQKYCGALFVTLLVMAVAAIITYCFVQQKVNKESAAFPENVVKIPEKRAASVVSFTAKVTGVYDGDTFTAKRRGGVIVKIRLAGIDAPELSQRYGEESREILVKLLGDDSVRVQSLETDRYGREIAIVTVGKTNINEKMVLSGAAWFYADYPNGKDYSIGQLQACKEKKGLWAETGAIPPWLYRKLDSVGSFGHAAIEGGLYLDKGGVLHNSRCTNIVSSRHRWNGIDRYTNCTRCGGAIFD